LLAQLNSTENDSNPALTADERLIVYTSSRPGGAGDGDLWYAVRDDQGTFGAPQPLPAINTASYEGEPFISLDGCELYFVSDRPGGQGHWDIHRVTIETTP
jgi:Tol biopolymer transport system component